MARGWPTRCSIGLYWPPDDTRRATANRKRDETSAWQNFPSRRAAEDQVVSPSQDGNLKVSAAAKLILFGQEPLLRQLSASSSRTSS